jgi:hypothetical protein
MIHLKSNQRLYISKDLRGYVDKLISDGTVPYAVDFLKLGFAYAVREELAPADSFQRHEITASTDILGSSRVVIEAIGHHYARETEKLQLRNSSDLLELICDIAISGGQQLRSRWEARRKSQVQQDIINLTISN